MSASSTGQAPEQASPDLSSLPRELSEAIGRLRSRSSDKFLAQLEERKRKEREWANFSRDREQLRPAEATQQESRGNSKWYSTNQLSAEYRIAWIAKHAPGKVVLDYACGDGTEALRAAKAGAALAIGIDVSDISVQNAARTAAGEGLSQRSVFLEGDCESTGLPSNSIDVILCCGMLHHLDLTRAYPEMYRILKPGGRVFAQEALNYNPIIRLYRQLTPEMRTEWEKEHILSLKDVRAAKEFFDLGEIRYWHLTSVFSAWTRGVTPLFNIVAPILNGVDKLILAIPGIQLLAWQFTFELLKPSGQPAK
jgi:ubiquinone/menaquinone biosynthesis C-methylase UbiE